MRSLFEEFDIAKLPANINELKSSTPTGWSNKLEQVVIRSMSFSEFEMVSHPVLLLTAVSTTDYDPLACMQEMSSYHHAPQCLVTVYHIL
jgi:hypothetical protein